MRRFIPDFELAMSVLIIAAFPLAVSIAAIL